MGADMTDHDTTRRQLNAFLDVLAQRPPLGYGHWSDVWYTDGGPDLFAAAFTAAEAARWQPIETAPKDGNEFLAKNNRGTWLVAWITEGNYGAFVDGWWINTREGVGSISGQEPTHWRELPPGPSVEGGR
jgi:hypothetical protein